MATFRPTSFLPMAVLRIFKDRIGVGSAWTVEEVYQALRHDNRWLDRYPFYRYYELRGNASNFDSSLQWLTAVLRSLAELGLVVPDESLEESSGFQRWRIGESWRPPEPPSGGDGGGGNIGPTNDGDDDGGGGGGLREALGHPVLLALQHDDFNQLVNDLFGKVQP